MTSAKRASGSVRGGAACVEIMRHCSSIGKVGTTREKGRKSSGGELGRVDAESSILPRVFDEFTVEGPGH